MSYPRQLHFTLTIFSHHNLMKSTPHFVMETPTTTTTPLCISVSMVCLLKASQSFIEAHKKEKVK